MKILIMIALICSGLCSSSQTIEIDKFTKLKRIESKMQLVYASLEGYIGVNFRSNGDRIFIELQGDIYKGVIGTKDALILLFSDSSTLTVYPTAIQGTDGFGSSAKYNHSYNSSIEDLKTIAGKTLVSIRRYYNEHYGDKDIKEKKAVKLSESAKWFISEFEKH